MDAIVISAFLLLAVVIFLTVNANWRSGVFAILGVGFLQDMVRKLIPGEPVAITAAAAVTMLLVWQLGLARNAKLGQEVGIRYYYPTIVKAFFALGVWVALQAVQTFVTYGSPILAGIGLLAYLSPLPAIWVGWWYCQGERDYVEFLQVYVGFGVVVAIGVYLAWSGFEWAILQQVGEKLVIYGLDGIVDLNAGFMRAPDIAGWHLGAATCFAITLAAARPKLQRTMMLAAVAAALVVAIILTGRRKPLGLVGLFVLIFAVMMQFSQNREARKAAAVLFALGIGMLGGSFFFLERGAGSESFSFLSDRSGTIFEDAWDRFYNLGIASIGWAIGEAAFLGNGAGVASQGAQHFGVELNDIGSAEGGLGKIVLELGVPGLVVVAWVLMVFAKVMRQVVTMANRSEAQATTIALALVSFLLANLLLFITASQVFGDPFILILMGLVLGALLATPRLLGAGVANDATRGSLRAYERGRANPNLGRR